MLNSDGRVLGGNQAPLGLPSNSGGGMTAQEPLAAMACNQPWKLRYLQLLNFSCRPKEQDEYEDEDEDADEDALLPILRQQSHLTHLELLSHTSIAMAVRLTDRFALLRWALP